MNPSQNHSEHRRHPKATPPISRQDLKLQKRVARFLNRLSARNRTARLSGAAEDRYEFPFRVYRVSQHWAQHPQSKLIAEILGGDNDVDPLDIAWFIRRLLRHTSKDDRRLRSKHLAALTYAAFYGVSPENITTFIQEKGGFNKCAERLRRRRLKGLC
jgi:hypothetical protein